MSQSSNHPIIYGKTATNTIQHLKVTADGTLEVNQASPPSASPLQGTDDASASIALKASDAGELRVNERCEREASVVLYSSQAIPASGQSASIAMGSNKVFSLFASGVAYDLTVMGSFDNTNWYVLDNLFPNNGYLKYIGENVPHYIQIWNGLNPNLVTRVEYALS